MKGGKKALGLFWGKWKIWGSGQDLDIFRLHRILTFCHVPTHKCMEYWNLTMNDLKTQTEHIRVRKLIFPGYDLNSALFHNCILQQW